MPTILVLGASGNVGSAVVAGLAQAGMPVRIGQRSPAGRADLDGLPAGSETVPFDLVDETTWGDAHQGITSMFVLRPPSMGHVRRDLIPALAAAGRAGVRHVVFLSLQGAEKNRVVPHAAVEGWLRESGMDWTFVRPSFFHQNLSTTHARDIRDHDEIVVPAGRGATAFVDARDVGAVAAAALLDPLAHRNRAWTVTGPEALTYGQVAEILSDVLGRQVRYPTPGLLRYARHARTELGMPWGMVAVTSAIYTTARLGLAAGLTRDVAEVLGRQPIGFAEFAIRERQAWTPR